MLICSAEAQEDVYVRGSWLQEDLQESFEAEGAPDATYRREAI